MRRIYTFNVREVVNRIAYVEASSLAEAWRKARDNDWKDASAPDLTAAKATYRRIKDETHDQ